MRIKIPLDLFIMEGWDGEKSFFRFFFGTKSAKNVFKVFILKEAFASELSTAILKSFFCSALPLISSISFIIIHLIPG